MFERTKNIQLSVIKQMELRAAKYPDVISLAQGIPSFDTPDFIKTRAISAMKRGAVAKYSLSPGLPELREGVELSLAKQNMFYDWQTEIIITVGSIEGITAAVLAVTMPGDEVILPSPSYTSYREVIYLAGCTPVYVPLNEEHGWTFELDKFEKAITSKTKAILFSNPNNPTGTIYSREQLLGLGQLAKKHNLYIIGDEVYKDFTYDLNKQEKIFSLAEVVDLRHLVIRAFSFSKSYAMTGWRVGYLHSDQKIMKEILKIHDCLATCAPVISQYAAMEALDLGEIKLKKFNTEYLKRRDLICARLDRLKAIFTYVKPTSAYYVFPRLIGRELDSWKFAIDLLENARVAVVPGIAFGPEGEAHVRMSFGRSEQDISQAFDRMEKYFKV